VKQWYCVLTKPRREQEAEEQLRRQDFQVFLPRIRQSCRRGGRWREVVEALFPRYLFVCVDLEQQSVGPIRSTRGVAGLVRFGQDLKPVPAPIIEALRQQVALGGGCITRIHHFRHGDAVTIAEGALAGLQAIFQAETGADRVLVLLELLGRANTVTLCRHAVVPAT